jgi:hypothetical protein
MASLGSSLFNKDLFLNFVASSREMQRVFTAIRRR